MSTQRLRGTPPSALPFKLFELSGKMPVSRFFAEDGWLFREFPGKGIEVVGRYDAPAMTSYDAQEMTAERR